MKKPGGQEQQPMHCSALRLVVGCPSNWGEIMAIARALSEEKVQQHIELYKKFVLAVSHANEMLLQHGLQSREFEEADKAAGMIAEDIHRLIGRRHWMG